MLDAAFRRSGVLRVPQDLGCFLHGGSARPAAATAGAAADDSDQRGRAGRAGDGCIDHQWRGIGGDFDRRSRQLNKIAAGGMESHNNPVDILGDANAERMRRRWKSRARSELRRTAGDSDAAGDDRSHGHGGDGCSRTQRSWESRCWRAGWAARMWRRGTDLLNARGDTDVPLSGYERRGCSTTCGATS